MPYAPGVYSDSSAIARGVSSAGKSIAAGIDKFAERSSKAKALRATAKAYDPEGKDKYEAMGLEELEGWAQNNAMQRAKLQDNERQARMSSELLQQDVYRRQMAADDRRMSEADDTKRRLQGFNDRVAFGGQGSAGLSAPDIMTYAAEAGILGNPQVDNLMNAATQYGRYLGPDGAAESPLTPGTFEDPVSGQRFTTYGKQILSSGVNPDKYNPRAMAITGEDGSVLGHGVPTNRGGVQLIPAQKPAGLTPDQKVRLLSVKAELVSKMHDPLMGANAEGKKAISDQITEVDALLKGDAPAASGKEPAGGKSPATAPAYSKGQRVNRGGKLWEYDGKKWVPIQ